MSAKASRPYRRRAVRLKWWVGGIAVFLVAVRLLMPFAAKENSYEGYCKVFFKDLKIFSWEKERKKDALEIFRQAIVGTLATAFKYQPHDQLATRIPITGKFEKTDVHVWPTVATLLRNAFVKSLVPKVDEPMKVEQGETDK